jgi:signal peptidase II
LILFRRSTIRILLVAIFVLLLDQMSKAIVVNRMASGEEIGIFSFLSLERTSNTGVAFGLASDVPPVVLALVASAIVLLLLILGNRLRWPGSSLAIGLVLGGALGNLVDRILRGSVVDFIAVPYWPTFNLADAAITVGVVVLLVGSLRSGGGR